jgi:deoxyribonuclease-4
VGYSFDHLARIIKLVEDKKRIGVCLDTAHAFAAGYDLSTAETCSLVLEEFEKKIGTVYLKGAHLNDSRTGLGSRIDRHASLGSGRLGIDPFRFIMKDRRFEDIPLILETPDPKSWAAEIELLYSMAEGPVPEPICHLPPAGKQLF